MTPATRPKVKAVAADPVPGKSSPTRAHPVAEHSTDWVASADSSTKPTSHHVDRPSVSSLSLRVPPSKEALSSPGEHRRILLLLWMNTDKAYHLSRVTLHEIVNCSSCLLR